MQSQLKKNNILLLKFGNLKRKKQEIKAICIKNKKNTILVKEINTNTHFFFLKESPLLHSVQKLKKI